MTKTIFMVFEVMLPDEMKENELNNIISKLDLPKKGIGINNVDLSSESLSGLIGNIIKKQIDKQIKEFGEEINRQIEAYSS